MSNENRSYFFCRSKKIMKHLRYEHEISFITCAVDTITGEDFWLFERSVSLDKALEELKIK